MKGTEQRHDIDAEGEEAFPRAEAQVDRDRRQRAGGEHFDSGTALDQAEQRNAADGRDSGQRDEETGGQPGRAEPVEQGDDEAAAQPEQEDVQRMEQARYHFDSVKASMESVFFAA